MRYRTAILTFGLMLGALGVAHAQGQGQAQGQSEFQQRRMQMMFQGITLTSAEQTKVDSILAAYRSRMPPRTPGTPPDSAAMAARRSIMEKQNADIRAVLTRDQQPVFDKNIQDMNAMMQQRRQNQR